MSARITTEHLRRAAVVYVRQSTMAQVMGNLESQRRQYDLAGEAQAKGFASVTVIDDDLGRSGSGRSERPGFERLVALVCSGEVGAVYCIEASRLARNGRDWHHLIDLCALAGSLVIDPDGAYDPRLVNDRLLLGLKGTMSEYELSLMRQRGIAARDAKAQRGEFRFMLPPGFCWSEAGRIEIDPDEHVADTIRLVFTKFRELGSARQVLLWLRDAAIKMPVVRRNVDVCKLVWKAAAYHSVVQILHNPLYAGAYAFGRTGQRTRLTEGRARTVGGRKARNEWSVLLRDHHPGYITWQEFEDNQKLLLENAHMKKNCARKSARGGRALLTGLMRCGHCGRMMRIFYGMGKSNAHRYQCRGDDAHVGSGLCIGIGGVRIDRAVAHEILDGRLRAGRRSGDPGCRASRAGASGCDRRRTARTRASPLRGVPRRTALRAGGSGQTSRRTGAGGALERCPGAGCADRAPAGGALVFRGSKPADRPGPSASTRPRPARGLECSGRYAQQTAPASHRDPGDRLHSGRRDERGRAV